MLVQCWVSVADDGTVLAQHWVNVCVIHSEQRMDDHNKGGGGLMLIQRRKWWVDIKPALIRRIARMIYSMDNMAGFRLPRVQPVLLGEI